MWTDLQHKSKFADLFFIIKVFDYNLGFPEGVAVINLRRKNLLMSYVLLNPIIYFVLKKNLFRPPTSYIYFVEDHDVVRKPSYEKQVGQLSTKSVVKRRFTAFRSILE